MCKHGAATTGNLEVPWRAKNRIFIPCNTAIPLLDGNPKELKERTWSDIFTPISMAALFALAKRWSSPNVHQQVSKQNVAYTVNRELFYFKEELKILRHTTTLTNLEGMLSEIITHKRTNIPLGWIAENLQTHKDRK